jgi:hypothetical protein
MRRLALVALFALAFGSAAMCVSQSARAITAAAVATRGTLTSGKLTVQANGEWSARSSAQVEAPAVGGWGTAEEVPGTASLNLGGSAQATSVSCASAGNCSAGGGYTDKSSDEQAFVVSEVNGAWKNAEEVPGTASLSANGGAIVNSVSCASAGNCSAVGNYVDNSGGQVFVVSEVNGAWKNAEEIPGSATLNVGGNAWATSVSCASAGNCSAGGEYGDTSGNVQAFVVSEVNGTWKTAEEAPGTATLNVGGNAWITSVSCASAGSCSAGGYYTGKSGKEQAFVVSQVRGSWGKAEEVPGTATLNVGDTAMVNSVSCALAGNCTAGGYYTDCDCQFGSQAFVVSEVNGVWKDATAIPGAASLNAGDSADVSSVSCPTAGNCSAGGDYVDASGHRQAFVVSEVNGAWKKAEEIPGSAGLNAGGNAYVTSVSCPTAGNCSAAGSYASGYNSGTDEYIAQAFVVSQAGGSWGKAEEVPGTASLNARGNAGITSVSCASAGNCSAGGEYTDSSGHTQAFVVDEAAN